MERKSILFVLSIIFVLLAVMSGHLWSAVYSENHLAIISVNIQEKVGAMWTNTADLIPMRSYRIRLLAQNTSKGALMLRHSDFNNSDIYICNVSTNIKLAGALFKDGTALKANSIRSFFLWNTKGNFKKTIGPRRSYHFDVEFKWGGRYAKSVKNAEIKLYTTHREIKHMPWGSEASLYDKK